MTVEGGVVKKRATLLMKFSIEFGRFRLLLRESERVERGMLK